MSSANEPMHLLFTKENCPPGFLRIRDLNGYRSFLRVSAITSVTYDTCGTLNIRTNEQAFVRDCTRAECDALLDALGESVHPPVSAPVVPIPAPTEPPAVITAVVPKPYSNSACARYMEHYNMGAPPNEQFSTRELRAVQEGSRRDALEILNLNHPNQRALHVRNLILADAFATERYIDVYYIIQRLDQVKKYCGDNKQLVTFLREESMVRPISDTSAMMRANGFHGIAKGIDENVAAWFLRFPVILSL